MNHLKKALSIGTSAALLASLLTTAFAGTAAAAAASITGAASSTAASTTVIPTTNVATALSTAPALTGTVGTDLSASGNLVLTLTNAAFSFDCTIAPTLTVTNVTFTGAVACAAGTLTSTFATTTATAMSVTWNGVKVKTTTAAASSTIVATVTSASMAPASVTVANVTTFPGGRDADRGMGHGARKVGFFNDPAYTCATGAAPAAGAGTFGFAILNTTGKKMLNVHVVLKGALPNATYDVWVNQDPGACPLAAPTKAGAVHTNALGNGTGHLRISVVSGAQHFWVSAVSGASVLRTRAAALTIKGK